MAAKRAAVVSHLTVWSSHQASPCIYRSALVQAGTDAAGGDGERPWPGRSRATVWMPRCRGRRATRGHGPGRDARRRAGEEGQDVGDEKCEEGCRRGFCGGVSRGTSEISGVGAKMAEAGTGEDGRTRCVWTPTISPYRVVIDNRLMCIIFSPYTYLMD
jgi:hypothetical protein